MAEGRTTVRVPSGKPSHREDPALGFLEAPSQQQLFLCHYRLLSPSYAVDIMADFAYVSSHL